MGAAAELKVYRASFIAIAPAWVGSVVFFVVGLSMVTIGPSQHGGVGSVVVGTLALLGFVWMAAVLATNRLIVTPGGLVHWNYLRRRSVGWAEVQSFGVGPSRSQMRWPGLVIRRNDGSAMVTNVVAFTRRYPARVADELAAWQRQLAMAALPGGDLPQAGLS